MILIANISCSSESSRTIFILPKMYILGNINSLQDVLGNMHVLQDVLGGMHVSRVSWVIYTSPGCPGWCAYPPGCRYN